MSEKLEGFLVRGNKWQNQVQLLQESLTDFF